MLVLSALFGAKGQGVSLYCTIKAVSLSASHPLSRSTTVGCHAKTSSSRLAGEKSWEFKLAAILNHIVLIWISLDVFCATLLILRLHLQQILVVASHAPSSMSFTIETTEYISLTFQGLTPASPVHLACVAVDARDPSCMPFRQSQMICLGEATLPYACVTIPRSCNSRSENPGYCKT